MIYQHLIPTDNHIRVTFGSAEPIDFNTLPPWIEQLDDRRSGLLKEDDTPVFAIAGGVMPSDLLRKILSKGTVRLGRVTVRKKIRPDNTTRYLLGFIFDTVSVNNPVLTEEGVRLLRQMLYLVWEQAKIYRRNIDEDATSLDVSLFNFVKAPVRPRFSELNSWGMRKLLLES